MNSLKDEDFKHVKEIYKDDLYRMTNKLYIIYVLKNNLIFVFVEI